MTASEPLETGWGPAAAPGDSLWNDFQQETARSFAELGRARGDRVERIAAELTMTDASTPLPFHNRAVLEQPIVDTERTVEQLQSFYGAAGEGPFLLDSAWPPPDLRGHGFMLMGHPPLMMRAADQPLPEPLIDGYPAPMLAPFEAGDARRG